MAEATGFKPTRCERYRIRLEFSAWVARMNTPPVFVAAIRALQAKADADVVGHFAIEADGSFWLDTMLMMAEG
jgi:hypothetical protein